MAGDTRVACIGTGLVGRAWAIVFARAGHELRLYDEAPGAAKAARDFAAEAPPELAEEGLLGGAAPGEVLGWIAVAGSLEEAVQAAAHVQESTPERHSPSMQRRLDWTGPVMEEIKAERRQRPAGDGLAGRQLWRDRRLMALAAHKRHAAREIGE